MSVVVTSNLFQGHPTIDRLSTEAYNYNKCLSFSAEILLYWSYWIKIANQSRNKRSQTRLQAMLFEVTNCQEEGEQLSQRYNHQKNVVSKQMCVTNKNRASDDMQGHTAHSYFQAPQAPRVGALRIARPESAETRHSTSAHLATDHT